MGTRSGTVSPTRVGREHRRRSVDPVVGDPSTGAPEVDRHGKRTGSTGVELWDLRV